ncbi:mechanosensitive ion channel family protein [Candidatus Kaiserbacteria bacterium CG10_big_fil_rev_8_21_14_0_10_59_10]|uniref:Mechanosensitive ion channel family protein n=1 Tax=Candidatus Kaiserbacteria bacterium CG10_big_fil_rev_8_21_14_0_10_59_10 TaxID=1974612 RepID=A0A2H0U7T0_9BACT|nr:MAG: mechanosensitive ion channel family protein [Candidatus Kaiserbacteria bacterium CG10_big_fil_rev_8_21_14_0_10_59_10]
MNMTDLASLSQEWLVAHGPRIVLILVAAYAAQRVSGYFIEKVVRRTIASERLSPEAEEKRENTLIQVLQSTASILIWIVGGLMILSELGVAIAPLLAAAGVAGIAFGFGGQYLIKDLIAGFFIIVENQFRVGDVVCIGATCGLVERVTLRITILRDLDGTVHHVPHGEAVQVSNLSKQFSRVNLNIGVSYSSDLQQVIDVVNRVGEEMASDPAWKELIISPPKFLRVDDFADSAVIIKILGDTKPLKQWDVTGELRKRLKIAFDKEGIVIPFPQRVIHQAR